MAGPATVDTLKIYLGLAPASVVDAEAMQANCDAANDLIALLRPDWVLDPATGAQLAEWRPAASQAAIVEAARLYGGRGSVQGVAAFADVGVTYIARLDPRLRELLQLGEYQPSVIA